MKAKEEITIKFLRTGGPFGDETCNYDVITNAETLEEFVTAILGKDNYQTICLRAGKGISSGDVCMAYATGGKITRKASNYDSLLTMRLKSVKVNGGWGNMTYDVWVEDELPAQDRKEFQMVYWGYTFD